MDHIVVKNFLDVDPISRIGGGAIKSAVFWENPYRSGSHFAKIEKKKKQ